MEPYDPPAQLLLEHVFKQRLKKGSNIQFISTEMENLYHTKSIKNDDWFTDYF